MCLFSVGFGHIFSEELVSILPFVPTAGSQRFTCQGLINPQLSSFPGKPPELLGAVALGLLSGHECRCSRLEATLSVDLVKQLTTTDRLCIGPHQPASMGLALMVHCGGHPQKLADVHAARVRPDALSQQPHETIPAILVRLYVLLHEPHCLEMVWASLPHKVGGQTLEDFLAVAFVAIHPQDTLGGVIPGLSTASRHCRSPVPIGIVMQVILDQLSTGPRTSFSESGVIRTDIINLRGPDISFMSRMLPHRPHYFGSDFIHATTSSALGSWLTKVRAPASLNFPSMYSWASLGFRETVLLASITKARPRAQPKISGVPLAWKALP
jgi:hypothetical protein